MDNTFSRPMTVGIYATTERFRSAPKHVAVMFVDDRTLVACTGYADDLKNVSESFQYARLFAESPKLLKALQEIRDKRHSKSFTAEQAATIAAKALEEIERIEI